MHNLELREAPLVRYQVDNLREQNLESLVLRHDHLVIFQLFFHHVELR